MSLEVAIPKAVIDANEEAEAALNEADGVQDNPQGTRETTPLEQTPAVEEQVAEPEAAPQPTEDYLQKYRTIQGKYNAEVPRLQAQVYELRQTIDELGRRRPQVSEKPPEPVVEGKKRYLKKEEVDEYGDSLLDLQSRMARGVAEEVADSKVAELRKEVSRLQSVLSRTSGESFWDKVERQVPDARAINESDVNWHEFLGTSDPVTGRRYRDLGLEAIQSGDSSRLVAIFNIYAATTGPVEGVTPVEEPPRATPPVKPNGVRTVSQAPKPVSAKGTIRDSEVTKFYNDVTRGGYKGREKEQAERELEIETAANEGRIVPG